MTAVGANVALVVSAFRSDDAVVRALEGILDEDGGHPFHSVVVVDSLGTGRIESALASRAFPRLDYRAFDRNLGSAGNLMERLRLAAAGGADFAYAINHDGFVDLDAIGALAEFAERGERIGAVYPARRYVRKGGAIDLAGTRKDFLGTLFDRRTSVGPLPLPVHWSSSNGALYALEPIRRGVAPWGDLWMGYEDLEYGWALERAGYEQWLLGSVVVDDDYEYRLHRVGPFALHVSDKPAWYAYYQARNLVLIARRHRRGGPFVGGRLAIELALTAAVRRDKGTRLAYLARGLADGLRGRVGKWLAP
jgi:GT2 family glycosyltransferase